MSWAQTSYLHAQVGMLNMLWKYSIQVAKIKCDPAGPIKIPLLVLR